MKLRPSCSSLKPGTRIVSNTFDMGDWKPDSARRPRRLHVSWCTAMMWMVPAKVAGTWRLGDQTLTLDQQFQMLSGTLGTTPIADGKLNGDAITFRPAAGPTPGA